MLLSSLCVLHKLSEPLFSLFVNEDIKTTSLIRLLRGSNERIHIKYLIFALHIVSVQ